MPVSLVFDIALLAVKFYRSRNAAFVLRFMALATIVNTVVYYMISGLTAAFGSSILLPVTCVLTAKIFVIWIFQQSVESDSPKVPAYLLAVMLSLFLHGNPIYGIVTETILLLILALRSLVEQGEYDKRALLPPIFGDFPEF